MRLKEKQGGKMRDCFGLSRNWNIGTLGHCDHSGQEKIDQTRFSHPIFLDALFLSKVLIMDDMSSINAFHLPLPAVIGTYGNDLGQFIAFSLMKD
jgi:hypothetical protein